MKNEMDVLKALKAFIINNLEELDEKSVFLDFPEVEKMKKNTAVFINPDVINYESLTINSSLVTLEANIFILLKGAKDSVLLENIFTLYTKLYKALKQNQDLDNYIDLLDINTMNYFPSVAETANVQGIEINTTLSWVKDI